MWFDPVQLTKAQPSLPATLATSATFHGDEVSAPEIVARIAKVASPSEAKTDRPSPVQQGEATKVARIAKVAGPPKPQIMWFDPAPLPTAQPSPPATLATSATLQRDEVSAPENVARIAKVATTDDLLEPTADLLTLINDVAILRGWSDIDRTETVKQWRDNPQGIERGLRHLFNHYGEQSAREMGMARCTECAEYSRGGVCLAVAKATAQFMAAKGYRPALPGVLQRCGSFKSDQPDPWKE